MSDAEVWVHDGDISHGRLCAHLVGRVGLSVSVECSERLVGSKITLTKPGAKALHFCKFYVTAEELPGEKYSPTQKESNVHITDFKGLSKKVRR